MLLFLSTLFVFSCLLAPCGVARAGETRSEELFLLYCVSDNPEQPGFQGEVLAPITFLQNKQVQSELGLSESQLGKLNEGVESSNRASLQPYLKQGTHRDSYENIEKGLDASRKKVAEVLNRNQMMHFKSLLVQKYGPWSLSNKDFREVLRFTPEQKHKLDSVRLQLFTRINALAEQPLAANAVGFCKYAPVQGEAAKEAYRKSEQAFMDLLTAGQRETLEKIKGKPAK